MHTLESFEVRGGFAKIAILKNQASRQRVKFSPDTLPGGD